MGSTGGFIQAWGKSSADNADRERELQRDSEVKLRERKADEIENAITGIQADTSLSPQEKAFKIGEAHKQLSGLYKPEEGPDLMKRLKKLLGHKEATPTGEKSATVETPGVKVGDTTLPGETKGIQLRPGLTLEEVLASGSAQPTGVKSVGNPFKGPDGKWYTIQEDSHGNLKRAELPGYSEESELQTLMDAGFTREQAMTAMKVKYGIEAKPVATKKGFKYDSATDEVVDQDTGERFNREDLNKKETPEVVARMFEGASQVQKHREDLADKRFNQSIIKQDRAIRASFDRGDYVAARRELNKAKNDYRQAVIRMETMDENKADAIKGNQQAMLSLVANHIGMTLGAQRGARITRAVWEEAMGSAPWLETKLARFFHVDPETGERTLLEPLAGVVLTPSQVDQMTELAHQKVDTLKSAIKGVEEDYADDLAKGHGSKPEHKLPPEDEELLNKLNAK